MPLSRIQFAVAVLLTPLLLASAARGQVVINEIKASSSDRILRWTPDDVSRLGVGEPWYGREFDDSSWNVGQGPMGYGVAGLNTTVDTAGARSFYVRTTFDVSASDAASDDSLLLRTQFDDGILVYLNGVEVLRKSLGPEGLCIYHDQYAYNVHGYGTQETYTLGRAADLLHPGENTLAIQVHNVDIAYFQISASSDTLALAADLGLAGQAAHIVNRTDTFRYLPGLGEPSGGTGDGLEFYDWIELHNTGAAEVSLSGWSLTDDPSDDNMWTFPDLSMAPGEYLLVFASEGESPTLPLQTNFRLTSSGDYLALTDAGGAVVDAFDPAYPPQELFHSYGRLADGTFAYIPNPTPGTANDTNGALAHYLSPPEFSVGSGLYDDAFQLTLSAELGAAIWYNIITPTGGNSGPARFEFDTDGDLEGWAAWNLTRNLVVSDGILTFETEDHDPYIGSPSINVPAEAYPYITIRLRSSVAGGFQIFWSNLAGSFHEDRSVKFQVDEANTFETKVLDLRDNPFWTGTTTQLRFDQVPIAGVCEVDFIRVTAEPETGPAEPTGGGGEPQQNLVPGREPIPEHGILYEGPIEIEGNTVIRTRAVRRGAIDSPVAGRSYLFTTGLPGDDTEALHSLPIISVIGDEERSLIEPFGFMAVVGGSYTDQHGWWIADDIDDYNNPIMHGRPYEGAVAATFLDPNTNTGVDLNAGMRIGRSDVARPSFRWVPGHWRDGGKWSFRLEFRNDYGQEWLEYPLQPENVSNNRYRSIALRTFGADPYNPFASEEFIRRIQLAMGWAGAYGTYANLFINGQYKCYMNVCDRLTEEYFQNHFDSDYDWDVIKMQVNRHFQSAMELHAGSYDAWNELIAFVRNNDLSELANYRTVAERVDVTQFIDWILVNVYGGNADWPWNNWIAARERSPEGQWRFYIWDADVSLNHIGNVEHPTLNNMENQNNEINELYRALKRSPEFRLLFQDRVQKHCYRGGVLTPGPLLAIFNDIRAMLEPVIAHVYGQTYNTWIPDNWIPYRTEFLIDHVADLGYGPALLAPTYAAAAGELYLSNPNDFGGVVYTLNGTDPRVPADVTEVTLVDGGAPKRVLVPTGDIGSSWYENVAYDDSGWTAGTGAAGYENGSGYESYIGVDVGAQMSGALTSCYVRIPFTVSEDALGAAGQLQLGLQYDDGCVAYLNGVEVHRSLAPDSPAWNSVATGSHEANSGFENVDISQHAGLLQAGENLLALHGLNIGTGSSDFVIDGRLVFTETSSTELAAGAKAYAGPLAAANTVPVMARVLDEATGAWSPLLEIPAATKETNYDWLKITEIMYHPADGGAEFLELRNVGSAAINIGGVYFSAGISFTFPENTVLEAGEYIVLVRSAADFSAAYPGIAIGGVYVGSLDNSGETITMRDPAGIEMVSVSYGDTPPWPPAADGQGFSLVIIDPLSGADDAANWRASGPLGGTPGGPDIPADIPAVLVNEALTHTDPPQYDAIEIYNPTDESADVRGWYLTDDRMDPKRARIPFEEAYIIPPGGYATIDAQVFGIADGDLPGFNLSSLGGEDAYIFSADSNGALTGYSHGFGLDGAANGVSFGRYVTTEGKEHFVTQKELTLGAPNAGPLVGPIVISAIHYHPPEGATPEEDGIEYIELKNITGDDIPLWDDADEGDPGNTYELNGVGFRFPTNTILPAYGRCVVAGVDPATFRATHFVAGGTRVYGPFGNAATDGTGNLANEGEALELRWPDEPTLEGDVAWIVMDKVRYNDKAPWPDADGNGLALRRADNTAYGNDPVNWTASEPRYTPDDQAHTADINGDRAIDTSELLRVVQFYHAGALACEDSLAPTEDRYVSGAGAPRDCVPHDSDHLETDWSVSLRELLRAVQFYNAGAYHYCPGAATEDSFCTGPNE